MIYQLNKNIIKPNQWSWGAEGWQKQVVVPYYYRISITCTDAGAIAVKDDGSCVSAGSESYGELGVSGWEDIVMISSGRFHTVGVKSDGTVLACGRDNYNEVGGVSSWTDIVMVACGIDHTLGLKSDGTVVACGRNLNSIVSGPESWQDIIMICAGEEFSGGVKADGTCEAEGISSTEPSTIRTWTDIKFMSCFYRGIIGIKKPTGLNDPDEGTAVYAGLDYYGSIEDSATWEDVVSIIGHCDAIYVSFAVKSNKTVLTGGIEYNNMVSHAQSLGYAVLVAPCKEFGIKLKDDGTCTVIGDDLDGTATKTTIESWTDIAVPHVEGLQE